ncbi:apolipoprotein D and lipocalin family protein [Sagittula marina]|uniref:Apolipoprotein D and lipocalin family protein n=1 Tax=Sagittula marina TaxID=943940 RepID=A0A7W6GS27_9RHOB|nr:apolipoprotein D and lipocalin family protein [Sagittula marina]
MRAIWVVALVALIGCAKPPDAVIDRVPVRNPTTPVASQADVTEARVMGDWVVVQSSLAPQGTPIHVGNSALRIGARMMPMQARGQGRFASGDGQIWVHWLDADNRTMALGDPEGGWFAILDRSGRPGERLRAAREILEWYGYDVTRGLAGS